MTAVLSPLKTSKTALRHALCLGVLAMPFAAKAADVSLLTGVYSKEENKANGTKNGSSSTIDVGARYGDMLDQRLGWFGQGSLEMVSYSYPSGTQEPSDTTNLSLGGGVRYIGKRWNEAAIPFLWTLGEIRNRKSATPNGPTYTETEENGLYYSGGAGLRLTIDQDIFVDLECPVFESALFATVKTKTPNPTGGETTTEKSQNQLHIKTYGPFNALTLNIGVKL